jgi:Trk K+ transport system NAD-binding subunit
MDLVADLTLVLRAALAGGFLAQRAGQPLIVGYIRALRTGRAGSFVANPDGQSSLEGGDLIAVLGTRDQIARFERAMQGGTGV